ncbi:MAG: hypothetical protein WC548_01905 [Candidatus Pacearchaeota archaeon]
MSNELEYKDLDLPTFVGSREAMRIEGYDKNGEKKLIAVPFYDVPKAAVLAGVSFLNIGDTRCGKSQLMRDIHKCYFGGSADNGGKSNWNVARNDFSSDAYFTTIDQTKVGEGKGMLYESKVPVVERVKALCNIVDEINLAIPEVQVEFFGMAEGEHRGVRLGEDGYHLFMASCNLNRVNGDFAGTSQINRALLNRFGVTFDFDYFRKTDDDEEVLAQRTGREQAEVRDISGKIIEAYQKISEASRKREPWLEAYIRMFSSGLDYCAEDSDGLKKKMWPSRCGGCSRQGKDICSLVKQSNTGTSQLLKRFANAVNFIIGLKHPGISLDPFDLALESFKFTTYHGNLNGVETLSTYSGEDQEQMRDVVSKIREKIEPIRSYIDTAIQSAVYDGKAEDRFIEIQQGGDKEVRVYSEDQKRNLDVLKGKKDFSYKVVSPFDKSFGEKKGIRIDWLKGYIDSLSKYYKKNPVKNES